MIEPSSLPTLLPLSLPQLTERRLDNGLNVVAVERTRLPLVSVVLAFNAGSARDPRGKAGLSDFVVELLRRGTERHSAEALNEQIELMGADLRLECSPDTTVVAATAPSEHAAPLLELVAELVRTPAFPAAEVKQARTRTVARLHTDLDEPSVVAGDAIGRVTLGKHPYGRPGRGLVSEVSTFTRADCQAHHAAHFRPAGAWLVVVGDLPAHEGLDLVEGAFGSWGGAAPRLKRLPPPPPVKGHPILVVDKPDSNQAQVRIACTGPGRLHPQLFAARLANLVFGGGFTSRLVDAIRVTRGLSYGASSYLTESEAGGLFIVGSFTKTESVRELVEVALEEARRYREEGPSLEELVRAQRYTNGLFPLALETVDKLARAIADMKRLGRESDWLERYRERILAVSVEEAHQQAREFVLPGGWAAALVGDARALREQIRGLGAARVVPVEKLA